jgi:hypothetical protein
MIDGEFVVIKGMVIELGRKVEDLTKAVNDYKLEVAGNLNSFNARITRIEQRCLDQHDGSKRLTDNLYKTAPIVLMIITLIYTIWRTK